MKVFILAGSAREGSFNRKLARIAGDLASGKGVEVTLRSLADYDIPLYHGDWEAENGVPADIRSLKKAMGESDAVVYVTPEYNGSIPGTVKNVIDWMSRPDKGYEGAAPIKGKAILIMSASPGYFGGVRVRRHLRTVLSQLSANVYGPEFGLPNAGDAFSDDGTLKSESTTGKIDSVLGDFIKWAG